MILYILPIFIILDGIGINFIKNEKIEIILGILLFVMPLLTLGSLGIANIVADKQTYISESQQIYALQDNSGIHGSFFLGCGGVNGNKEVAYAIKDEADNIEIKSINMDDNKVTFKENNKKVLNVYREKFTNPIITWWFGEPVANSTYEFNVPKGSITTDFNVDLK